MLLALLAVFWFAKLAVLGSYSAFISRCKQLLGSLAPCSALFLPVCTVLHLSVLDSLLLLLQAMLPICPNHFVFWTQLPGSLFPPGVIHRFNKIIHYSVTAWCIMDSKITTGGIQTEFVKRIKAVSSGSNTAPQNTKSGPSLMKCRTHSLENKRNWEVIGEKETTPVFQTEIQPDCLIMY